MEYYVVMPDGSKFGPASIETLNEWAQQGRILPTTMIERASDGVQGPASLLPGLILPSGAGTPPAATGPSQPAAPQAPVYGQQPSAPQAPVYGTPAPSHGPGAGQEQFSGYPRQQGYSYDQVPHELQGKFNWGAFLLNWIWGLNHKAYITLITLGISIVTTIINLASRPTPSAMSSSTVAASSGLGLFGSLLGLVNLGLCIFYGVKGYEWAWQSGRFATPEECKKCQATWGWWGLGVILFCCVCGVIAMFTVFAAAFSAAKAGGGAQFR